MKTLFPSVYTGRRSLPHTLVSGYRTLPPTVFTGSVLWTSPDNGLWVATSDEGFLGMVEEIDGKFRSTNSLGALIGTYATVEFARDVIGSTTADPIVKGEARTALLLTAGLTTICAVLVAAVTLWVTSR